MAEEQEHLRAVVGYRWHVPIEAGTDQNGQARSGREDTSLNHNILLCTFA